MKRMILTLAFAFCLQTVHAEEPVKLEMKYLVGKTYTQNMHMQQEMAFEVAGNKLEQEILMDTRIIMKVTEGDKAGTKNVGISYDRIAQSVDMNGQKMAYDSDKPEEGNPMLGIALKGLIGKSFTMVVDEKMEIKEILGIDEMLAGGDEATAAAMKKMLSKEYLEQIFHANLTQALPENAVVKGDKWDVEYSQKIPDMGSVKVSGKMSHDGADEIDGQKCVKLGNNLKMEIDLSGIDENANPAMAAMAMRIEDGKMEGSTWWDPALGYARKAAFTQTMTMSMKNPETGEKMTIPMVQSIETTVSVD